VKFKLGFKKRHALIVLYVAIAMAAAYVGYTIWAVNKTMDMLDSTAFNQYHGPEDAEKVIVEFIDYRCSYCREIHGTMMKFLERNPDVKIVYRHYLIFGKTSHADAAMALTAGRHGHYTAAHEFLIGNQDPVSERQIDEFATSIGVDPAKFRYDMKSQEMGLLFLETLDMAQLLGIRSTPSFVIGDIIYNLQDGMPTVETFEKMLAEAYGE